MLVCYLILIFYFQARGGYQAVQLPTARADSQRANVSPEPPEPAAAVLADGYKGHSE